MFPEIEAVLSYFEPGVVQRNAPATEEMIINAEQLLGTQFPPSLRSFLQSSNGMKVWDVQMLGLPQVGEEPNDTIVDWSRSYREEGGLEDIVVLIQDGTGNPFGLFADRRDDRGECAITKIDHETGETLGVIASSYERLLWFVFSDLQCYLRSNGEFKDDDQLEAEEIDEEWNWYEDRDYSLQHDPNLATF